MTELDRLLELQDMITKYDGNASLRNQEEYKQLKSKINEKLEKVCDFPLGIEQCAEHGKEIRDYKQQIKQLKEEVQKEMDIGNELRINTTKQFHEIQSLKSQNEKLQKVIDEIRNRIKKIEDEYPYSNNCKPSDTNSDYILLKSILKEVEK